MSRALGVQDEEDEDAKDTAPAPPNADAPRAAADGGDEESLP